MQLILKNLLLFINLAKGFDLYTDFSKKIIITNKNT